MTQQLRALPALAEELGSASNSGGLQLVLSPMQHLLLALPAPGLHVLHIHAGKTHIHIKQK